MGKTITLTLMSEKIEFRVGHDLKARLDTMARQNYRTPSAMARILLEEALNQRECSEAIRLADRKGVVRQ